MTTKGFQVHGSPASPEAARPLTAGAINFFMAAGGHQIQPCIENLPIPGPQVKHQATKPVYGPSKTPVREQFVDLATDSGRMTPFHSYPNDVVSTTAVYSSHPNPRGEEETMRAMYCSQPYGLFYTPEQDDKLQRQQQCFPQVSVGAPTPSSAMGMTATPATACRGVIQITPCTSAQLDASAYVVVRKPLQPNVGGGSAIATTSTSVIGTTPKQHASTGAVLVDNPMSLARELEWAYVEQQNEAKTNAKGERKEESEAKLTETPRDNSEKVRATRMGNMATKRRPKEQRVTKGKNGQQNSGQSRQKRADNKAGEEATSEPVRAEGGGGAEKGKSFTVLLRCHGGRQFAATSSMKLGKGVHVIFEGDRGVDLGEVLCCDNRASDDAVDAGAEHGSLKVIRRARPDEVGEWRGMLVAKGREALGECRDACKELGLT
ncbi:hypothetical protein, conserved (fragment), partial [Trypanosoma vivax Y486]